MSLSIIKSNAEARVFCPTTPESRQKPELTCNTPPKTQRSVRGATELARFLPKPRRFAGNCELLACDGVRQLDFMRMQEQAARSRRLAIEHITHNGMAQMCQMDANLMTTTGDKLSLHQRMTVARPEHANLRSRRLSRRERPTA